MSEAKRLAIRLALSAVFGLSVMMVPLYLVVGSAGYIANGQFWTRKQLEKLDKELQDYRVQHAAYPAHLEDLGLGWGLKDRWNRPFLYLLSNGKPLIQSLGRDGVRGGIGFDADFSNQNPQPPESAIPLWQKVTDPIALQVNVVVLICGMLSGTAFFQEMASEKFERKGWLALGVSFLMTFLLAAFGACMITIAHVPSGH